MVKLRLKRCDRKQQAGIGAMDVQYGIDLWKVGFYDPITNQISFYFPAILDFLKKDAQPTRTVHGRLKEAGVFFLRN